MNIWNTGLNITADISIKQDICTPSAYSLHTNWLYSDYNTTGIKADIVLNSNQERVQVILWPNRLEIVWDLNFQQKPLFNPQFLSTWNKWIISKFISHVCELSWIVSLHACGLYHPNSWAIKIWIWTSWWGKTAFVSSGIESWWLVIATEMIQITEDRKILPWNTYDVIWGKAAKFFQSNQDLWVKVCVNDVIFDQTGSKCLADFSQYQVPKDTNLNLDDAEIVFLQFWDKNFRNATPVFDHDMSLRFIGHSASEKIESVTYLWNDLVDIDMHGHIWFRNKMIHVIQTRTAIKLILWWQINDFRRFLNDTL